MSAVASSLPAGRRPASRFRRRLTSTVGLKLIMAVTGVILSLFVLGHMLGNLQVFQGAEAIDAYGRLLRREPALLWAVRAGLLAAVVLHIWAFVVLFRRANAARPQGYRHARAYRESTYASRTMKLTGPLVLAFIIYHILHMTTGTVHPSFEEGAVYHNLTTGLAGIVGAIYVIAMILLAFHLWHGVWSMLLTLGLPEGRYRSLGRNFATVFTALVTLGFIAIPLAIMTGLIK